MKLLFAILGLSMLLSCGAYVGVDYNEETDFSTYTTYNFYPDRESGLNQLDEKRIMRITDSLLQQKGFIKSDTPQLYVNFFAEETLSNSRSTIGIGIGGGGRNVGGGVSGGIPIGSAQINQLLTFDLVDVVKDDLVWQAKAEGNLKKSASPGKKVSYYQGVISKILKKYPPKKK
ncbi:DUF4136 domain-containing protein [Aureitalea sp. L0-47]|uniref:DUF4136 domain-containing protein n=1 Tax=Aureitalea sp. L0-47 TaxID=2816962 RepID=UPI0022375586|nr:DUF4136 domain-containing protein [Aureitalea sp. L0-47]MCW5520150.1 DUF4136 domain-containing protein [Aureitalea sp. L0-47]